MTKDLQGSIIAAAVLLFTLGGCGESDSMAVDASELKTLCQANLEGATDALCDCLAEKAADRLSDQEFALLIAGLKEDEAESARLRNELALASVTKVGMFMVNTPQQCAQELDSQN